VLLLAGLALVGLGLFSVFSRSAVVAHGRRKRSWMT
jgi:hypothetical protein